MGKVLIIEDDAAIHSLIKETLEQRGFHTLSAYSGTEGKLLFEQNEVDVILLDLMLPGINGEQFLQEIRSSSAVPVIVISARNDQQSKLELLTSGADDYIVKPFDVKELLARMDIQLRHAYTSKAATPLDTEIRYHNITVNTETREVKLNDQTLHLTGREYEILLLLLEHPHKVFSRANIYESVWNEPFMDSEKTINTHISNLRNKLHSDDTSYIKTVWGIGFKFD